MDTQEKVKATTPAWMHLLAFVVVFVCVAWFSERHLYSEPSSQAPSSFTAWVQPHWYEGPKTDLEDGFDVVPLTVGQPGLPVQPKASNNEAKLLEVIEQQKQLLEQLQKRLEEVARDQERSRINGWRD